MMKLYFITLVALVSTINMHAMEQKPVEQKHTTPKEAINNLGKALDRKGFSVLAEACYKTTEKAFNSPTGALALAEHKKGKAKTEQLEKAAHLPNGKASTRWIAAWQAYNDTLKTGTFKEAAKYKEIMKQEEKLMEQQQK